MKIIIYGAGALGQALGCMLASDGHQVDFILRPRFQEAIGRSGLRVSGILGDYHVSATDINMFTSISQTDSPYDYLLLTTKSYDTRTSLEDIAANGSDIGYFVSMQNGCGNLEQVETFFGPEKSFGGRVITGFEIIAPGQVKVTVTADAIHLGTGYGGEIPQAVATLAEIIEHAGHPCQAIPDIRISLYAKLLYNCTLNPLGAILGVHYGALGAQEATRGIMDRVIDETFTVITALGGTTPWPDSASYKKVFYNTLLPATSTHRPSMLQDLENRKPTEVEALVGWVQRRGEQAGIAVTTCAMLADLIRFRESQVAG